MEALTTKHITKEFVGHTALSDVSIGVPKGSIYGLLGPNGAGKSTLIRIVTQILSADSGEVFLDERKISTEDTFRIGYLPEERGLYKRMKVGEQLRYLARLKGVPKAEAISKIGFWLRKLGLQDWQNKNVQDLSKGMQQKIQFIAMVMSDPDLIILDEPFSGFDPINTNTIKNEILELREKGATIIFSTHRMESVEELCDHLALINNAQKVLEGSKSEIKDRFKANSYRVGYRGNLDNLDDGYHCEKIKTDNGITESEIRITNGNPANELLRYLIDKVEVISFNEKVPTINEIFINQVSGRTGE